MSADLSVCQWDRSTSVMRVKYDDRQLWIGCTEVSQGVKTSTRSILLLLIVCTACPAIWFASSPVRCRLVRPPGNLDRGQSYAMWLNVWFAAPQLQYGSGVLVQRARFAAHYPWPFRFWNGLRLPADVLGNWNQEEDKDLVESPPCSGTNNPLFVSSVQRFLTSSVNYVQAVRCKGLWYPFPNRWATTATRRAVGSSAKEWLITYAPCNHSSPPFIKIRRVVSTELKKVDG